MAAGVEKLHAGEGKEAGGPETRVASTDLQWGRVQRGEPAPFFDRNLEHFQDYDAFDLANEDDVLEEFLGLERRYPKVGLISFSSNSLHWPG